MAASGIVGVIPARYASTRFPGKVLTPIAGRPLVLHVLDRARRAKRLDAVVVATDDERVRDAVEADGGTAVMTWLEHPTGTDRVAEVVREMDAGVVVNIQGDEPLIDPALIDRVGGVLQDEPGWEMSTAATPLTDPDEIANPSNVKVVVDADGGALYFSRAAIPHDREGEAHGAEGVVYWRHLGIYGYRREFLERLVASPPCLLERLERLEQLRALYLGARIKVLETHDEGIGVDEPGDVERVAELIRVMKPEFETWT